MSKTEIIKVDAKDYGVPDQIARNVRDQFVPMLNKMTELEDEYNEIVSLPVDQKETQNRAKELRKQYVKIRTGTAKIHKEQKDFYLKAGKFIDGWKNAQLMASGTKEEKLKEIEEYEIRLEQERIEKLHNERLLKISAYVEDTEGLSLGSMPQDVFDAFLIGKKKQFEEQKEAEREAERIRKQREEALEIFKTRSAQLAPFHGFYNLDDEDPLELMSEKEFNLLLDEAATKKARHQEELEKERSRQFIEPAQKPAPVEIPKGVSDRDALITWINSFEISNAPWLNSDDEKLAKAILDIEEKFVSFKNWAKKQV